MMEIPSSVKFIPWNPGPEITGEADVINFRMGRMDLLPSLSKWDVVSRIDVKNCCWRHDLRIIPGSGNGVFGRCWQVGIVLKDLLFCIILTMNMCILCRFAMVWCYMLKCSLLYEEMVMSSFPRRFFPMNLRWTVRFTLYRIYAQLPHNFLLVALHLWIHRAETISWTLKITGCLKGMKSYTHWYEVLIA